MLILLNKEVEEVMFDMCEIMENLFTEEKIEMAKNAIVDGDLTLSQIAKILDLPLAFVQELSKSVPVNAD